jgi:hypothetical protein
MGSRRANPRIGAVALWGGAAALLFGAYLAGGLHGLAPPSHEAVVVEQVCREFLRNTTEGRQALVSSAWWPPAPVLMRLPVAAVLELDPCPIASLFLSALFGAASVLLLFRALGDTRVGWARLPLVLALACHPAFVRESMNGSSATSVAFFVILTAHAFGQWVGTRQVRFVIHVGVGSAMLAGICFSLWRWLLLLWMLLALDLFASRFDPPRREAVLILAILPPAYVAGLWFLMDWLIMGDPVYFLRAVLSRDPWERVATATACDLSTLDLCALGLCVAAWLSSLGSRCRAGLYAGVLVLGLAATAALLASWSLLWDPVPVLFCLFPASLVALGAAVGRSRPMSGFLRLIAAAASLAVSAFALSQTLPGVEPPSEPAAAPMDDPEAVLARIESHVLSRSRYARVFVCGYDSFRLLRSRRGSVFQHALDFNFDRIKTDYFGHALFVLVRRPAGRHALDSIHWKYDRIFELGSVDTLDDGMWGEWRLFEVVQAPRRAVE